MRKVSSFPGNAQCILLLLVLCFPGAASGQSAGVNPAGWIETRGWNLLLPLLQDGGCNGGGEENLLRNWVAPHQIGDEDPRAGDPWSIDFNQEAAANGYASGGISEGPLWVSTAYLNGRFDAEYPDGEVVDLLALVDYTNANIVTLFPGSSPLPATGVLGIATTYLSNNSGGPLEVEICSASDDSIQIWVNDELTTNVSACRELAADCEETRQALLPAGTSKIAVLVWQGDAGWSFRLGVRSSGSVSLFNDSDASQVEFLGSEGGPNCPAQGDTHSTGLTVAPEGGLPGEYLATATALDDGGETVLYTFTASNGIDSPLLSGPQTGTSAAFTLGAGEWTISVLVDDDPECPDEAADARSSKAVSVVPPTCGLTLASTVDAGQARLEPSPVQPEGCNCDQFLVRRDGTEIFRGSFDGPDRAFPFPPDCAPGHPVTFAVFCLGPGGEGSAAETTILCPDDHGGEVTILPLALGSPSTVALGAARRRVWFRLEAPAALGRLVRVSLTDPDAADANALYLRWGELPLPHRFDQAADAHHRPNQELVIPYFQGGTLYLLAQTNSLDGAANEITLLASLDEVVLTRVRPGSVGRRDLGLLNLTIEGGGFQPGMVFILRNPITGKTFPMSAAIIGSSSIASGNFDLAGAPAGSYELIAQVPGLSTEKLEGAFQITNTRRGPLLSVELRGSERYRNGVPDVLFLHVANVGDEAMSAPLLKVVGPEASAPNSPAEFRLEGEEDFATELPQLLGLDPDALSPTLDAGTSVTIPIQFRLHQNGVGQFRVYMLTPRRNDYVPWDSFAVPAGLTPGQWSSLLPLLAERLGYTWPEYQQALASRGARLARRRVGVNPFSVRESFRFAAREALDLPASAVVGRVRESAGGSPLAGKTVLALEGGLVKAFAVTDPQGFYSLDWLQGGHAYQVRMVDHDPAVAITLPLEGDVLRFDFLAAAAANGLIPACPNCATSGLPDRPVLPPDSLFTQVATYTIEVGQAIDPNTKEGPAGQGGDQHLIGPGDPLWYKINFENEGTEGAFAQKVQLEDQCRSEFLNLGSIIPRSVGVFQSPEDTEGKLFFFSARSGSSGNPEGTITRSSSSSGNVEGTLTNVGANGEWDVGVTVRFDPASGLLDCTFETYHAGTSTKPPRSDFGLGFLPQGGTGHLYFEASPKEGLPDGTVITNDAEITFDDTSSLRTNQTQHTFTSLPPQLPQNPVPGDGAQGVRIGTSLSWTSRRAGGFDVYLWKRSGQFPQPTRVELTGFTPAVPLEPGTVYLWQVVAINSNGESQGDQWLFETEREPSPPGPPADPFPPDLSSEVPVDRPLSFAAGQGAASHQVFFWPEGQSPPRLPMPLSLTRLEPALQARTTYLWQVRAVNIAGATDGPLWRFRTGSDPLSEFLRGDVNGDRTVDISDAVVSLSFQFLGTTPPGCEKSADTDDSGLIDITDAVTILNYLFLSGAAPGSPFPDCGLDPVPDGLTCDSYDCP